MVSVDKRFIKPEAIEKPIFTVKSAKINKVYLMSKA